MTAETEMRPFRRVLVAFDPSPQGQALLELAAELAESFGTPLSGLYIEDEAMISYAASPLANEVTLGTASLRALSSERMRAHFRVEAGLARRAVESLRAHRHLECSFQTGRGRLDRALEGVAAESDLLLLSPRLGPAFDPRRPAARQTALARSLLALFEPARARQGQRKRVIQVIAADAEQLGASLALAGRLAARRHGSLSVAVVASTAPKGLERQVRAGLGEGVDLASVTAAPPEVLLEQLRRAPPELLVLGPAVEPALRKALARLGIPLLELSR